MRARITASQRTVNHIRTRLRKDITNLALTHKGCDRPRGCGCLVDKALTALQEVEALLFRLEVDSYADPTTQRRIVQLDNTIGTEEADPPQET